MDETQKLQDIQEHQRMVEQIVKALSNISYYLERLKTLPSEFKDAPASLYQYENSYKRALARDFKLLSFSDNKDYIYSYDTFWLLYDHLRTRYKNEIRTTD